MNRVMLGIVSCLSVLLLSACGGGGGGEAAPAAPNEAAAAGAGGGTSDGSACFSGDIHADFSYAHGVQGTVGTPMSVLPDLAGFPGECARSMRFALASGVLPPGVALDPLTGAISGTPTEAGQFRFEVRITVANFTGSLSAPATASITSNAVRTFSTWEAMTSQAPFQEDFSIARLGGKLYVVSRGFYSHVVETYESADGGATWNQVRSPGPTGDLRGFALAYDATAIYLSGGSDGTNVNNAVWRFDGTAWRQLTPAGAFAPREAHAMVSHAGALYVFGGRSGLTFFQDTWKSTDGGTTWTLVSATGAGGTNMCAVSGPGGYLYIVNGGVLRSADGSSWTSLPVSSTSPLKGPAGTHDAGCAVLKDRIVYVGGGPDAAHGAVSSADGVTWDYEPYIPLVFHSISPVGVALDGRIYMTTGSGSSQRFVVRSVP